MGGAAAGPGMLGADVGRAKAGDADGMPAGAGALCRAVWIGAEDCGWLPSQRAPPPAARTTRSAVAHATRGHATNQAYHWEIPLLFGLWKCCATAARSAWRIAGGKANGALICLRRSAA